MKNLLDIRPSQRLRLGWRGVMLWLVVWCLGMAGAAHAQISVWRYGVYNNAPKIFMNEAGVPAGIWPDLLNALAREQGWALEAVPCEWQECLRMVEQGEIDFMPDVALTAERQQRFDFHLTPMLHSWSQLYVRTGAGVESLLDLQGKRVAVMRGSVQETFLRDTLAAFGVETELVPVDTLDEAFVKAGAGDVQAAAANHFFGDAQAVRYNLVGSSVVFQPSRLYVVTARGHAPDLLASLDEQLSRWRSDPESVYFQTLRKWSGAVEVGYRVPPAMIWATLAAVTLALLAVLVSAWLRRQVRRVTADLRTSRDQLNTILDGVGAMVFIKDTEGRYLYANRPALELMGTTADEIRGKTDAAFFPSDTAAALMANDRRALDAQERVVEEEVTRGQGDHEWRTYLSVKMPLRDAQGQVYALCGISTDLTAHRQAQEQIHALVNYDPLTHLPNRRLLLDRLQQSLQAHRRSQLDGAVLLVDVDGFSLMNNTLGYEFGDQLLREVASRLSAQVRSEDTVARLGSDEFVLLLHDLSGMPAEAADQVQGVLAKIRRLFETPFALGEHRHVTSACVGVALFSDADDQTDDLLKLADLALHQAKAEGRGAMCFFNPEMQAHARQRADMEAELRQALIEQQFVLEYQPQFDDSGQVIGVEALVRWEHPVRGRIPPGQFIGVAESCGLILPLGRWILEAACWQLVKWQHHPVMRHWVMAVNMSARQFRQERFVEDVMAVLERTGASPALLELELTESLLVDDVGTVTSKMGELRRLGVQFALDDFGTGYSSLNYLRQLPLNRLKVDKSFVDALTKSASDVAIVKTIVTLADALGLHVIAEGVETDEQKQALARLGVRQFQGYLLARPMPAQALEKAQNVVERL